MNKLSPADRALYRICGEALFYLWDPIGINGVPQIRNEYQSYIPTVFSLVKNNDREGLLIYLKELAEKHIGMPTASKTDQAVTDFIFEAQACLEEDERHATHWDCMEE